MYLSIIYLLLQYLFIIIYLLLFIYYYYLLLLFIIPLFFDIDYFNLLKVLNKYEMWPKSAIWQINIAKVHIFVLLASDHK